VNNEHVFKVNVEIGDLFVIEGDGFTKKQAEQDAAQKAIQAINKTE
jgi:dsRNA-specific ribonuclease